jgi:DNA-binding winged helix-turn-helix (wHTH) protein/Tfp pilus assembly protein PilF
MTVGDVEELEFGSFVLVPRERLLLCGGQPVRLSGKAFDLLVVLARRSGRLVTKDELMREVWPSLVVEEVNLSVNISAVRKALAREAGGAGMIQTVPKSGYRFVAPVSSTGGETTAPRGGRSATQPAPSCPPTADPDAYRLYLEARYSWGERSEAGLRTAIAKFERAVKADPRFAAAYSGMADAYAALGTLSFMAPGEAFPAAWRHAEMAVARDPDLAEPHASLGYAKFYYDWDWSGGDAEFRRAIELDPDWAAAHQWYSIYLLATGRPGEALDEIGRAREREPMSLAVATDLGFHFYYSGRYSEAVKQLQSVLAMKSDFAPAHLWLGRSYQQLGKSDEAVAALRHVETSIPDWSVALAARGFVEGIAGHVAAAEATLEEMARLSPRKYVTPYGVALVHAGLGRKDAAFSWLDRAFAERSHWLVWLRLDPRWDALRSDPRFAEMIARLRYPRAHAQE